MNLTRIANIRLINQRIANTEFSSAKEIVGWMGAMQAQDFSMAKWAVGLRLKNPNMKEVEMALNSGDIIRTHLMRPTWHFVQADDIYWMLELTAPHIKPSLRARHKQLELTEAVHSKSEKIVEKALWGGQSLSREELREVYAAAGIQTDENRLSHLLMAAELNGLICSGPIKGKKQTYALLSERVPYRRVLTRLESLAELANRYFTSHGPATIHDFSWWSGLSLKDARQAIGLVASEFISETIDGNTYWFRASQTFKKSRKIDIHLLPAYDEFLISYRDRSASLSFVHNKNVISDNGIFRPVILINGQVAGLWKCSGKNGNRVIEISFLQDQNKPTQESIKGVTARYSGFWGEDVKIKLF